MPASDQAELSVDLAALAANYKTMQKNAGQAETSAVVKADGYGLGMAHIAPAGDLRFERCAKRHGGAI